MSTNRCSFLPGAQVLAYPPYQCAACNCFPDPAGDSIDEDLFPRRREKVENLERLSISQQ